MTMNRRGLIAGLGGVAATAALRQLDAQGPLIAELPGRQEATATQTNGVSA
jgi:hypothetical protein